MKLKSLFCFAALLLASLMAWGQAETAQITGTVLDATGAAVPKATIIAKNTATGATRNTTATNEGNLSDPEHDAGTL